jgi:site-specific recombinase XerD
MPTALLYAKALRASVAADGSKATAYIENLRKALESRGHQKLLPAILSEYQKLDLAEARNQARSTTTPETERTRALLELYRRLVSTN